jgi:thiamine kinase-like enzyme
MCWQLAADEALVVEFDRHDGFWMLSNNGVFFNSMDYLYRPVSYTPSRARVDSDGKVRLILCHDDPGYHNWLDTQGFVRGNLTYRNLMTDAATVLDSRLVKRARLAEALPDDSVKITREERIAQLRARFDGIRRRYRL